MITRDATLIIPDYDQHDPKHYHGELKPDSYSKAKVR